MEERYLVVTILQGVAKVDSDEACGGGGSGGYWMIPAVQGDP